LSFNRKSFDADLLDKIPAGIVVLDKFKHNQPVFANKKAREDLKLYDDQKLSKELFLSFFDPLDRQRFLENSSTNSLPEISEWKGISPSGKSTWVQLRVAPLSEEYSIVIIRNIGKIKKILADLSSTEAQYQALIERDPNFIFIFKNGSLEVYNQAFNKLGYTKEEIEQQKRMPTFFVAPEHREKIARFIVAPEHREKIALQSKRKLMTEDIPDEQGSQNKYQQPDETTEFNLLCKDGSRIPVHAIVRRVYSGKDVIIQGVLIDLSSLKAIQDMKLDFLTLTQHNLRTPIANLRGYLDFYKKRVENGISTEDKQVLETKLLEVFSRNIDRLVDQTQELNDISLIRRGKFKCNLRGESFIPILQQVLEDIEFLLRQYRIDLIVEYPTTPYIVNLDRNRISQALRNVLENAIRFTGHGVVEINFSIENGDNQYMKLSVKDNGIGIDSANLDEVGKPFVTFHPSASRLGLGLYLTKEIIENHNGTFEITSSGFNRGTTVAMTLPLLVSTDDDTIYTSNGSLNEMIKTATTSENILKRMEAVHQLGNRRFIEQELEKVISALEKVILYDKDRTIRNLAGQFYSKKVETKKKATPDAV
jgi:PAS domain S-box-containing protein